MSKLLKPARFRAGDSYVEYPAGTEIRIPSDWRSEVPRVHLSGYDHSVRVRGLVVVWLDGMHRAVERDCVYSADDTVRQNADS